MTHIPIADHIPTLEFAPDSLKNGIGILSLILMAGLARNDKEARRLVESGAVRIDEQQISDPEHHVLNYAFDDGEILRLSVGPAKNTTIRRIC